MDFWARQAEARQRSRWLVLVFIAAVLAVVLAVNFVVLSLFAVMDAGQPVVADTAWLVRHPRAVAVATLGVLALIGIANLYRTMSLASGGGVVARSLGGTRVQADTSDPLQRRLLNVVEEMAIASGVPVPAVYVLEQEEGINAFAAGHTPANAAIAVTRGTLRHLERAELQGVIAHEFSHILNGDMRLNIRLMGLLFGLLVIAIAGRTVYAYAPRRVSSSRRGGGGGVLILAGLAVMAIGYVGVFFGRLIQAAVSRQREFLADASAVQFTREPGGLRGALVKIGSLTGSRLRHPEAEEVAHMLFAPGMTRWFATHPPLLARIRALDPSFDPAEFNQLRLEVKPQPLGVVQVVADERLPKAFSDSDFLARSNVALEPGAVPAMVGNPDTAQVNRARRLREALQGDARHAERSTAEAVALLFALVLDAAPSARALQMRTIHSTLGGGLDALVEEQARRIAPMPAEHRLPLLGGLVPVLRELPLAERRTLLDCLAALCRTDGQISVFEYAVCTLARVYLAESLATPRPARRVRLAGATVELQALLSIMAAHGHASQEEARQAYARGMALLGLRRVPPFNPVPGWSAALDRALLCLDGLPPQEKSRVLAALAATIVHDGRVSVAEGELLRAVCAVLHCPLPPLVGSA